MMAVANGHCYKCGSDSAMISVPQHIADLLALGRAAAAWLAEMERVDAAGEGYSVSAMLEYADMDAAWKACRVSPRSGGEDGS